MISSLDIVIVNWNAGKLLLECVRSIGLALNGSFKLNSVTIVDNASQDNSLNGIEDIQLPINLIRNADNFGFARSCNLGAGTSQADYILFLNPDTRLFENSLQVPITFLDNPMNEGVGIVGVKIVDEKENVSRNCARFPTPLGMIYMSLGLDKIFPNVFPAHFMTEWDHLDSRVVDQIMGSFLLIRRDLFKRLNGFDERFFVYYEDADLSLRAKQNGYLSYYLSAASVYHKGGGVSEKVKAQRLFYNLRSKILYSRKHFNFISGFFVSFFILFCEPVARVINAIFNSSIDSIKEILSGYKKLYLFLFLNKS